MYGAYLLAVYDPDTETYQTICKIGTGFSEEELEQLTQRCAPHIIDAPKKYYAWHENLLPDVWLDAAMVGRGRSGFAQGMHFASRVTLEPAARRVA